MSPLATLFYRFAGVHSLLIGLLPFFIPILLWQQGYRLAEISAFIAITGIGFIAAMSVWKTLYYRRQWRFILIGAFVAELALVSCLIVENSMWILALAALLNGVYNCFYWVSQRAMFCTMTQEQAQSSPQSNTGRHFGNFQIVIVILLKLGILIGGYLLSLQQPIWLWVISAAVSLLGGLFLRSEAAIKPLKPVVTKPLIIDWRRKIVFLLDGVFLFFESYFWVLTLFFIAKNDVMELGLLVVGLTIVLSVIFWGIKNTIDGWNQRVIFYMAVGLYAMSWMLRGALNSDDEKIVLLLSIMLIAFLTSFFRLSFNKQFFDDANSQQPMNFVLLKSYLSQGGVVLFFGLLAWFLVAMGELEVSLNLFYWCIAPLSILYGVYPLNRRKILN